MVWTGDELVLIANPNGVTVLAVGASFEPDADRWRALPESPIYALNTFPQPIWTGEEVLVMSASLRTGLPPGIPPATTYGGFFDPESDTWRTAAVQPVFQHFDEFTWIGDRVFDVDAIYDPQTDLWSAPPPPPHGAWEQPIWTGKEVLLWGGSPGGDSHAYFNDGLAYRPAAD